LAGKLLASPYYTSQENEMVSGVLGLSLQQFLNLPIDLQNSVTGTTPSKSIKEPGKGNP